MSMRNVASRTAQASFSPPSPGLQRRLTTGIATKAQDAVKPSGNALSRISNKTLIRSLVLTSMMRRNWIMWPSLKFLNMVTRAKSVWFNPDRNPVLNRLLRWTIYNHFCAGTHKEQVARSMAEVKGIGYQGIILGHAKEAILDPNVGEVYSDGSGYAPACYKMVEEWKQSTLDTLRMLQPGDFLAVKLTGAGPICLDAMQARQPMPQVIVDAMGEICTETKQRGSRLWIDAEQQILQIGLDDWVIELMRKYNRNGEALVYNTIQAYLKGARDNAARHITFAAREGWTIGIKLVRGAYIEHDVRSLIHDTKEDTDRSYDDIVEMMISRKLPQTENYEKLVFPSAALFLATHNQASAEKAVEMHSQRISHGLLPLTTLECGQINGMADELSCELLASRKQCVTDRSTGDSMAPGVFKYIAWGSVSECMGYLHRRAIENRGAVERTQHMVDALKKELRRRIMG
ncbi:FAD-linked oxidoreductase-like protein [Dactylonectria estremocensis]|uniref:Proline dehydrogenase n=1 Tax=Dactylonectria estremocensis TaxID=1079267 RepID=A0A9P9ES62_9HYPO|nr:FAD-linked oxidoreductase-like protein [Dactylonectria estremocensis]